ncbi:hypothetical protein HNQ56_000307 [Anaerotaenia torta]|uniref:hypothetical protein n=1 Tax=Anaerotaenia torta TaxID=433293 RepID=UPI003D1FAEFD
MQVLREISSVALEVTESFGEIEQSIAKQTGEIGQIREGLSQISAVVQTNAATAEENSATSEEMSAQAVMQQQEVGRFKLWEGNRRTPVPDALNTERGFREDEKIEYQAASRRKTLPHTIELGKYG